MRKITASILACILFLFVLLPSACADQLFSGASFTSGYYTCQMLDDGTAMITGYSGEEAELVVPSILDDIRITVDSEESNHCYEHYYCRKSQDGKQNVFMLTFC